MLPVAVFSDVSVRRMWLKTSEFSSCLCVPWCWLNFFNNTDLMINFFFIFYRWAVPVRNHWCLHTCTDSCTFLNFDLLLYHKRPRFDFLSVWEPFLCSVTHAGKEGPALTFAKKKKQKDKVIVNKQRTIEPPRCVQQLLLLFLQDAHENFIFPSFLVCLTAAHSAERTLWESTEVQIICVM